MTYNDYMKKLNKAHKEGKVSTSTYVKKLNEVRKRLNIKRDPMSTFDMSSSLEDYLGI